MKQVTSDLLHTKFVQTLIIPTPNARVLSPACVEVQYI